MDAAISRWRWATRLCSITALVVVAAACQKSAAPTTPTPAATDPPAIACPASVAAEGDVAPVPVVFQPPRVSGGTAPVSTQCSTEPGQGFPEGTTDVVCTATDAIARRAQCTFTVMVSIKRTLKGTSFLAFGDSVTAGEVTSYSSNVLDIDPINNYPKVLETRLRERYREQPVVVVNAGFSGRHIGEEEDRLVEAIREAQPAALLLMHGYYDVKEGFDVDDVIAGLRLGIRRARQLGVTEVFLANLAPQTEGNRAYYPEGVLLLNARIRELVDIDGVVPVDVYAAVEPAKAIMIGKDGLHPTVEGYAAIAGAFFEAIATRFEATPGGLSALSRR